MKGDAEEERIERGWHAWYDWFPVWVDTATHYRLAWWRTVERRRVWRKDYSGVV